MESITLDPIKNLPYEISMEIFKYLLPYQLINASLVSKMWYQFIAESQTLMRNIKIKTYCNMDRFYSNKIIKALTYSTRKYENIEIEKCPECMPDVLDLLRSRKWKEVTIDRTTFHSDIEVVEFFKCIEENVEILKMSGVFIRNGAQNDGINRGFLFPKLKYLIVKNIQAFFFHGIFQNLQNLERFDLYSHDQTVASLNAIMHFFNVNENLRCLQISGQAFRQFFLQDMTAKSFPFKLNQLRVADGFYRTDTFYQKLYHNLSVFMKNQSDSLEDMYIDDWMGEEVLNTIYELPNLRKFTIKSYTSVKIENIDWNKLNLKTSKSIVFIDIVMVPADLQLFKAIFAATPSLRFLNIAYVNMKFMDVINTYATMLTHLTIRYLNITHVSEKRVWFKNVKSLKVKSCRFSMKDKLAMKPYEKLSNFEIFLLHAIEHIN